MTARWPWRYARLRFRPLGPDTEVTAQTGPTVWGPWGAVRPVEMEQVQAEAKGVLNLTSALFPLMETREVIVRLRPRREGGSWEAC